jgi:hypothetical protein
MQLVGIVSLYPLNETTNTLKPTDADVWIVDGARVIKLQREFLTQLFMPSSTTTTTTSWKVLIVDFTDRFSFQLRKYHQQQYLWESNHVRIAVRSIVLGRQYNNTSSSSLSSDHHHVALGRIAPNLPTAGGPMLHCPYAVRSDIVEVVERLVHNQTTSSSLLMEQKSTTTTTMQQRIQNHPRPMDVVHLWQIAFKEGASKLRNDVSKLVRGWNTTNTNTNTNNGTTTIINHHNNTTSTTIRWKTSIDEYGERRMVGRNAVDALYVQAMLSSKIVIVTQKDGWEDHYRLFEALVCGPLVIADAMLAPPKGLVHGETLLFFHSLEQLQALVLYYLTHEEERRVLAQKGYEIAMGRHRSWHRMEELLFGQPALTNAGG